MGEVDKLRAMFLLMADRDRFRLPPKGPVAEDVRQPRGGLSRKSRRHLPFADSQIHQFDPVDRRHGHVQRWLGPISGRVQFQTGEGGAHDATERSSLQKRIPSPHDLIAS